MFSCCRTHCRRVAGVPTGNKVFSKLTINRIFISVVFTRNTRVKFYR
jgi:hypothetical protein